MKHKLRVSVSKDLQTGEVVNCRNVTIRERLLCFLFGGKHRGAVLIPVDDIAKIAICETGKGEDVNGQHKSDE